VNWTYDNQGRITSVPEKSGPIPAAGAAVDSTAPAISTSVDFRDGYAACMAGKSAMSNPNPYMEQPDWWEWERGYEAARRSVETDR
jgi:hypothetical protein